MTRPVTFLRAAQEEAAEAIDWYEDKEAGLGREFREAVETAVESIQSNPLAFPIVQGSRLRRAITHRFPYSIIYSVDENGILIVAVFHMSRNPMIWRGRV
jgi:plasmid stabilization system protein ParE